MLSGTTLDTKKIQVISWNNCKCRVLTTLRCYQAVLLIEEAKPQDRYGYLNIDKFKCVTKH